MARMHQSLNDENTGPYLHIRLPVKINKLQEIEYHIMTHNHCTCCFTK